MVLEWLGALAAHLLLASLLLVVIVNWPMGRGDE